MSVTGPLSQMSESASVVQMRKLDHPNDVSYFIRTMKRILDSGTNTVMVDLENVGRAFPNACVPIAAVMQHYKGTGVAINVRFRSGFLGVLRFEDPLVASPDALGLVADPLSKIWKFQDEKMVSNLVSAFVKGIMERVECTSGVALALEWCLNEVMDNVLQHSETSTGFAMVQVHTEVRRVAICVADTGLGIYGTLARSVHKPRRAVDAITLAVKEGVTRDPKVGQGNGLWGLLEIVKQNGGRLCITSGEGSLFMRGTEVQAYDNLPFIGPQNRGTIVDFQLDASRPVDIAKALSGHQPVNLMLEGLETETGEHIVLVREHSHGTGTRRAAEQLRNLVVNLINEGANRIVLDFSGIGVVSSSFADEFIGKLVVRYGFFGFQTVFRLKGMNEAIQGIVHRSVAQRMMDDVQTERSE